MNFVVVAKTMGKFNRKKNEGKNCYRQASHVGFLEGALILHIKGHFKFLWCIGIPPGRGEEGEGG